MATANTKRRLYWALGGLLVVIALAYSLAPKPLPADFAAVTRGPMQVTLDHEGKTRIRERFEVSAPFDGRIGRVELEPGDPITTGETVLVTLWPNRSALLDPASHDQAAAAVRAAEAQLQAAVAERQRSQAASELAISENERLSALIPDGFVSPLEAERAATRSSDTSAAYRAAKASVHTARYQLEAAQARLRAGSSRAGQAPGQGIEIHSPISGVVLRRHQESEAAVRMGDLLLEIGDPRGLEVVADFLSNDAVQMETGMTVRLNQWGGETELVGRVQRVEPAGFLKVSALGVEEQRVNVVIDFESPYEAWSTLGDGFRVEVQVITWQADDVLIVPTNSLFRHQDRWATFVLDGKKARLQAIEIAHRNPLQAEVLEGLAEGDIVIVHPSEAIEDGVKVAAREM